MVARMACRLRRALRRIARPPTGTILLIVTFAVACDNGPTGPGTVGSSTASSGTLTLTGTWSGNAADSGGVYQMTWQLTQNGQDVTGTAAATTPIGAPLYTSGIVGGTLSGTTLTFTVTIPRGGIAGFPDCTATFSGSSQNVSTNTISGIYSGMDSCRGPLLDGRVMLLKR